MKGGETMSANHWRTIALVSVAAIGGALWTQLIAPSDAIGYPAGAAVSYGANPIVSAGGYLEVYSTSGTTTRVSASPGMEQAGYDLVITDVTLSTTSDSSCIFMADVLLEDSTDTLAAFSVDRTPLGGSSSATVPLIASFESGLRVADGDSLTISSTIIDSYSSTCSSASSRVYYTLTGYLAAP